MNTPKTMSDEEALAVLDNAVSFIRGMPNTVPIRAIAFIEARAHISARLEAAEATAEELRITKATLESRNQQLAGCEESLKAAFTRLEAADKLAEAAEPFAQFNSSEDKIVLTVNTAYITNLRKRITTYRSLTP